MKFLQGLLPLAATASALVVPNAEVWNQIALEDKSTDVFDRYASSAHDLVNKAREGASEAWESAQDAFDDAYTSVNDMYESAEDYATARFKDIEQEIEDFKEDHDHDKHPHHPHHPHKPHEPLNLTVWQMINESKYSTKLAKLIGEFDDIVELLNSTKTNVTVFAPTDEAFEKIPDHAKKPSKEILKKVLLYHVVPDLYPAWRVLNSHTLPTLLEEDHLSESPKDHPQRLAVKLGWTGLFIDNYSKVIMPNIAGKNGVLHAVNNILVPPPSVGSIIEFFPASFSTYLLAARHAELENPSHVGGTLFIPPNFAWQKLGTRVNAFLFSKYGKKYLKAILEYHGVANQTLYSDAFYGPGGDDDDDDDVENIPKGIYHVDLPTLLHGKNLGIDIARYGRLIEYKVNAFTRVVYQDGAAKDGVIQVVNNVIIPPKKVGDEEVHYAGEELTVEDLKERLAPFVSDDAKEETLEL